MPIKPPSPPLRPSFLPHRFPLYLLLDHYNNIHNSKALPHHPNFITFYLFRTNMPSTTATTVPVAPRLATAARSERRQSVSPTATTVPVAPRLATAARSERRRSVSPTATTAPASAAITVAERIQERKDRVIRELGLPKLKGMFCFFLWSLLPFAFDLLPTLPAFGFSSRAFLFSCHCSFVF